MSSLHPAVAGGEWWQAVQTTAISLDDAPAAYAKFDAGAARKYVIDPHGVTGKAQALA